MFDIDLRSWRLSIDWVQWKKKEYLDKNHLWPRHQLGYATGQIELRTGFNIPASGRAKLALKFFSEL